MIRAEPEGRLPTVSVADLEIAYRRQGEGPPLVLLHGAFSDGRVWRRQLADLSDELTVVAWDEPGAGDSSDPPETFGFADFADILAAFIQALVLAPAHIGGLSWGGVVAQELYRRHPECVRSLILADTYAGWKGSLPPEEVAARVESVLGTLAEPVVPNEPAKPWPGLFRAAAPAALLDEMAEIAAGARPATIRRTVLEVAACDTRDLLPRIRVPTLLLWGAEDARSPLEVADQFQAAIPSARLVVIPGAGHMSNWEQPARFNAAILEFCRGRIASRPASS
jgi:pimeloyl-ACP methyl ester carboxylesterase